MVDTVRTLAALQALLADNTSRQIDPQDLRDLLVSVFPRATNFAPSFTATGGGFSVGSAQVFGNYAEWGDLVKVSARMVVAADTSFGSGNTNATLPVAADTAGGELRFVGIANYNDQGTKVWPGYIQVTADGTSAVLQYFDVDNAVTLVAPTLPFVWANTDVLSYDLIYQKRAVT